MSNNHHNNYSILSAPIKYVKRKYMEENEDKYFSYYELDKYKIIQIRGFRRLAGKTQLFLPNNDDDIRNRLTHTIEVVQIATLISNALSLNIELTTAISLGHDLGHTPFGHIGERTLNLIMNNCEIFDKDIPNIDKGFKHNLQGVRVCCHLAHTAKRFPGINLTNHTIWGIMHHSNTEWNFLNRNECIHNDKVLGPKLIESVCLRFNEFELLFY